MKKEQQKNKVSEKLGKRTGMYIDRFHFKNHIGKECVQKRDPYKIKPLNDVNTQVSGSRAAFLGCQQTFKLSGDVGAPFLSLLALHL